MIGLKKLSAIRRELRDALVPVGDDPISWLEEHMAVPQPPGSPEKSGVLNSLRRILESANEEKPRKRHVRTKK